MPFLVTLMAYCPGVVDQNSIIPGPQRLVDLREGPQGAGARLETVVVFLVHALTRRSLVV